MNESKSKERRSNMSKNGSEEVPTSMPKKPEIPTKKPLETPHINIPEVPNIGNHETKEVVLPYDFPEIPKIPLEVPYEIERSRDKRDKTSL
jgi:hypothetical protein